MRLLDNDPDNPCIGCGPANPIGLKLSFAWDGQGATAPFTVAPEHVGWPGSCHTGVLYIALVETVNWTLWGKLEQAGLPRSTSALETHRRVPVGETLTLQGRLVDPDGITVRAQALDEEGEVVAGLERTYELVTEEEARQRLGYDELPEVLEGFFAEEA